MDLRSHIGCGAARRKVFCRGKLPRVREYLKKVCAGGFVAIALGCVTVPAMSATFEDFIVNETSVPGTLPNVLSADKISGAYTQRITFLPSQSFTANAYANFALYLANDGSDPRASQLGVPGGLFEAQYGLYGLFTVAGVFLPSPEAITFFAVDGDLRLFIDPLLNTTKSVGATGGDPITLGGTGDDYLIASSTTLALGSGTFTPTGGFYDLIFVNFALTSGDQAAATPGTQNGELYFTSPFPFHVQSSLDGDFDTFALAETQTLTGDLSLLFLQARDPQDGGNTAPEPGILALVGVALFGLTFTRRARRR